MSKLDLFVRLPERITAHQFKLMLASLPCDLSPEQRMQEMCRKVEDHYLRVIEKDYVEQE